jgi:Rrf2 family iron-sulfur cluster assembly transcriptional regulator
MRLTTNGRYGVRAVAKLAAAGRLQDGPVSISQIAGEEDLSPEFLEQIFFKLKKAGVIRSVRGPKGGFVLNRKPDEITITTILDAVGEPLYPAPCTNIGGQHCSRQKSCDLAPVWGEFHSVIRNHLSGVTVEDIIGTRSSDRKPAVRLA